MRWFKRKYRQIKRTIEFLPLIWRGADWDYRYAVDLFTYQLSRTADYIEDNNRCVNSTADSKRIRTVVNLLEKVYEEEYGMEYLDIIKKKYGTSKFEFKKLKETDKKGDPYYEIIDAYDYDYTDSELLMIAEERHAELLNSAVKQKRAHKLAWELIEHNIQQWWD